MSQFDSHTRAGYVAKLCNFLGKQHPDVKSIKLQRCAARKGRPPKLSQDMVEVLERGVNAIAARCEATDGDILERIALARKYRGYSLPEVGRRAGVTPEAARQWCNGIALNRNVQRIASALDVPVRWLEFGGARRLPANSPLGIRVGAEAEAARNRLHEVTLALLQESEDQSANEEVMAGIGLTVFERQEMAVLARRAGGRWHPQGRKLVFVPWKYLAPRSLTRRHWDDEVEAFISDAMATQSSVYSAWCEVQQRAEAKGLKYPALITIYKRAEKLKAYCQRFGVDPSSLAVAE